MKMIPQVEPFVTEAEAEAVASYLRSGGWLTEFRETQKFASAIADFVDVPHCEIVTNGTVGLYLGLLACGVGPGDAVVVPDLTMIATPNAVRWAGADVVLADVDPETLCLDLDRVRLTPNTRALIHVSLNGRSGDMSRVVEFCKTNKLWLIEDACQALGSNWRGQRLGTFGDLGVYSFTPHKIITTGQGGAIVTRSLDLQQRISQLKDFCRTAPGVDQHTGIGFNFKFTDIQAVVGLEQLKIMDFRMARRRNLWKTYHDRLRQIPGFYFLPNDLNETVPWFGEFYVEPSRRESLQRELKARGIGTRLFYPPIHSQPPYQGQGGDHEFPVSTEASAAGLWLPSSIGLSDEDLEGICVAVEESWKASTQTRYVPRPRFLDRLESRIRLLEDDAFDGDRGA